MFVAAVAGIWFLIGMVGDPADLLDELQNANWAWVVLAFCFWIVVEIGYSISMLGAIPPANDVPFGPLTLLQVASVVPQPHHVRNDRPVRDEHAIPPEARH